MRHVHVGGEHEGTRFWRALGCIGLHWDGWFWFFIWFYLGLMVFWRFRCPFLQRNPKSSLGVHHCPLGERAFPPPTSPTSHITSPLFRRHRSQDFVSFVISATRSTGDVWWQLSAPAFRTPTLPPAPTPTPPKPYRPVHPFVCLHLLPGF